MNKVKVYLPNGSVNYHLNKDWRVTKEGTLLTIKGVDDLIIHYAPGGWWYAEDMGEDE